MKDLTRREIALLCAYALLLVLGIAWIVRSFTGSASSPHVLAAPQESAPAAVGESATRLLRVRLPDAQAERSTWRCFATRPCPAAELDAVLALDVKDRWEAELSDTGNGIARASFAGLPREPLHVALFAGRSLVSVGLAGELTDEVVLVLDPARLAARPAIVSGAFVDAGSRAPLAGELVASSAARGDLVRALASDGRFELELPAPANVQLVVRFPDRAAWRRDLHVEAGERLELGTIELPRAPAVRGQLRRAGDGPRAFPVLLEPRDAGLEPAGTGREVAETEGAARRAAPGQPRLTYSEEDGRFLFVPVVPGPYLLRVPAPDEGYPFPTSETIASRVLEIEVRAGELAEHLLDVEPVQLVRVQPADESLLLTYELRDAAHHLLRAARLDPLTPPTFQLPAGSYELLLQDTQGERARIPFEVTERTPELLLDLPPLDE